ncbi:hypothetical protein BBJ28_00022583 [Nothophytophthora sp. Chile5]|nr:hypothetical protein BBJ28_00022583 [Nothophytophthora sp. Chile5]
MASTAANDPLAAVQQLQSVVAALAPVLRPQVLPKGAQYGLDLVLGLCQTDEQRQELMALIHQHRPVSASASKPTNDEDSDGEQDDGEYLEPQVVGSFDAEKRVFSIERVQWMHERDAVVHEFARFLELQLESPEAATLVVAHFLEANGHKSDDILLAEQCFNAAFALQTVLRAFPRPPIAIKGELVEITRDSDVAEAFAPLFAPIKKAKTKAKAKTQSPGSKNKPKQQKAKKRKSGGVSA